MQPQPEPLPLYVCLYVPEFPAQALLRLRPELLPKPVVVLEGLAPLERVCGTNTLALGMGVRHGMTRAELDSFPGLTILKRSLAEERSAQAALLEAACAFTPRTELQAVGEQAWAAILDMTGSERIFGTPIELARRIERSVKAMHFSVQVGVSGNLHAAMCLARAARRAPIVVEPGKEMARLASLPLGLLDLTPQQSEAFALWGLRTFGELAAIAEEQLIVRLGQAGKRLRLLVRGEHPHLMVPAEPVFTLEEFLELDAPVELLESLLFVLGPMLGQLIARAQNHAFALESVTVKLGLDCTGDDRTEDARTDHDAGRNHVRLIKPALPLADRELLLKLLQLDLDAHPPPAGVVSVSLSAEPGDRSKVQLGLFSPQLPEPTRLDVTLARIAALVGEEHVGRAELKDTQRAEGFVMKRFQVPAVVNKLRMRTRHAVAMRRLRPPMTISMRRKGVQPSAFYLRGKLYTVDRAAGPWRRSGDWWSAEVWSSEEWDVEAHASEETLLCRVNHDLLSQQWQLDAFYD